MINFLPNLAEPVQYSGILHMFSIQASSIWQNLFSIQDDSQCLPPHALTLPAQLNGSSILLPALCLLFCLHLSCQTHVILLTAWIVLQLLKQRCAICTVLVALQLVVLHCCTLLPAVRLAPLRCTVPGFFTSTVLKY
jgi:hypothetical protein